MQILWRLGKAADFRDEDTGEHVVRVACYSTAIAEALALPRETIEQLFLVAPLHDIGKIGIPDSILLKPDRLTHEERQIMQQHCKIGERILQEPSVMELCSSAGENERTSLPHVDPLLRAARDIAAAHHERWDGEGYPNRLKGPQVPLPARIVAVADVYDALTSERPYKSAMSAEQSIDIIKSGRGTQFDPGVVDAFLNVHDRMKTIRESVSTDVRRIMSTIAFNWPPESVDPQLPEPTDVLCDGDAAIARPRFSSSQASLDCDLLRARSITL